MLEEMCTFVNDLFVLFVQYKAKHGESVNFKFQFIAITIEPLRLGK